MTKNKTSAAWEKDFSDFLSAENTYPPLELTNSITALVHGKLNPSPWSVFGKISFIQVVVGAVSLLFCPQFGVGFTSSMGIMPYLMRFGEGVCMLGCGAVFTGISLLAGSFLLRPEEVRVLKDRKILQLTSLATLSLGALLCLGGEVVATLAFVWILGALLGGAATLEVGWRIRRFATVRGTL